MTRLPLLVLVCFLAAAPAWAQESSSPGPLVKYGKWVVAAGAVGIYNVATVPRHQRSGCGEAVMRSALTRARQEHGIERTILQSTAQGFDLYRRMGYAVVTNVAVYTS